MKLSELVRHHFRASKHPFTIAASIVSSIMILTKKKIMKKIRTKTKSSTDWWSWLSDISRTKLWMIRRVDVHDIMYHHGWLL
jgi:hypothetical protein